MDDHAALALQRTGEEPRDRGAALAGALLGAALGDALGLPCEGMSARAIARRFGRVRRFHLLGRWGFVSDDTEQSALVAQSLARHPQDLVASVRAFRRALLGWFLRLPFGIGLATIRACLRILCGLRESGVASAGNGAAMRAAIVGVFLSADASERRRVGTALAQVTHRDPRAVEGALFVSEVAALAATSPPGTAPAACLRAARAVVREPTLGAALDQAQALAGQGASTAQAAAALGNTGFILPTAALASFCFERFGSDPLDALAEVISAGGDTDSIGAIVGAWVGALHGAQALPAPLLAQIHDGPFGPSHLRALAADLLAVEGVGAASYKPQARYSALAALLRNLLLYPVILAHGLRRLLP